MKRAERRNASAGTKGRIPSGIIVPKRCLWRSVGRRETEGTLRSLILRACDEARSLRRVVTPLRRHFARSLARASENDFNENRDETVVFYLSFFRYFSRRRRSYAFIRDVPTERVILWDLERRLGLKITRRRSTVDAARTSPTTDRSFPDPAGASCKGIGIALHEFVKPGGLLRLIDTRRLTYAYLRPTASLAAASTKIISAYARAKRIQMLLALARSNRLILLLLSSF